MLETHIRSLLEKTEKLLFAALDLGEIPEDSSLPQKIGDAHTSLHESLDEIVRLSKKNFRTSRGPLFIPIPGRDPREWKTISGKTGGEWLKKYAQWKQDGFLIGILNSPSPLTAPQNLEERRVLDRRGYIQAIRQGHYPFEPVPVYGNG